MPYSQGNLITLAAARGGWNGYITEVLGGPGPVGRSYRVQSPLAGDRSEGFCVAEDVDIAAGPLTLPTWNVNDKVTLGGQGATVTVDNGDDTYDLEVEFVLTTHLTITRTFVSVPAWRLALENTT